MYKLLIAQTFTLLAANMVAWYSLTAGTYLAAMGHRPSSLAAPSPSILDQRLSDNGPYFNRGYSFNTQGLATP